MATKEIVTKLTLDNASVKKGLSDSEKTILKFSAVIAGVSASMAAAAVATAHWQDATIKASRSAGVSVETFSALSVAAEKSNVSTEDLSKSLGKINTKSPEMAKNLASVGVSMTDVNGKFKSSEVILGDVADQMAKFKNPANQAMVATKVFGEEGGKLVNLLKDGKAGLEAARKEAEKYGLVLSESAGMAAEKFNDDMVETKNALKGLTASLGESIIAWVNTGGIMNIVRDSIAGITQLWRGMNTETKNVIITVGAILTGLAALVAAIIAVNAILPSLKAGLATAFGPIGIAIMALTAVVAGFVKFLSDYGESAKKIFSPIADAAKTAWESIKSLGNSLASVFSSFTGSDALQKELERTGKNLNETRKAGISFGDVMAGLGGVLSTVFTSVAFLIGRVAENISMAVDQIQNLYALVRANQSRDFAAMDAALTRVSERQKKFNEVSEKQSNEYVNNVKGIWKAVSDAKPISLKYDTKQASKDMEDIRAIYTKGPIMFKNEALAAFSDVTKAQAMYAGKSQAQLEAIARIADEKQREFSGSVTQMGIAYANFTGVVAKNVSQAVGAFETLNTAITAGSKYATQVQLRDLEVVSIRSRKAYEEQRAIAEAEETEKVDIIEKSYDDQIQAIKDAEAEKTAAIEFESKQRLLLNDAEYQTAKQQAEDAHAAFMESERLRFEEEKALMDERTIDKEQRRLNEGVMDANWQAYVKAQEALLQQQLNDLAKNSGNKKTQIDAEAKAKIAANTNTSAEQLKALEAAKAAALEKAESDKNKRMAEIDAARTAQEKDEEKKRLQLQYDAEVQEFEQTRAVKSVQTIASGIAAAAQAFAATAGALPFGLGIPIGLAIAGTILGATAMSVSQINSQRPVKPAALIAEDGGLVSGARHSGGGVDINAEDGELILSRGRTAALFDAMDSGNMGGHNITINFNDGAIRSNGDGRDIADMIAEAIGVEIRRLGIVGA